MIQRAASRGEGGRSVAREVAPGPPIAVTYRLTERGMGLGPTMDALRVWAGAPVDEEGKLVPHEAAEESVTV
ncbi:winged helix-turn-helix transcriptional regulator [Streptomyces sp. NPDC056930]|uniref:winged helix-turn-helix transcriptional regulator n=1 Tax=Streptomyces sp. NPDC056930 TaxID=3345967 RepID=UPI00362DEA93